MSEFEPAEGVEGRVHIEDAPDTLRHRLPRALGRLPARCRWSVHNLIAHPLSEFVFLLGFETASATIHDATIPESGENGGDSVRVRIAVSVNEDGDWYAAGHRGGLDRDAARDTDEWVDGVHRITTFIEADLPLPVANTVEAEVVEILDQRDDE